MTGITNIYVIDRIDSLLFRLFCGICSDTVDNQITNGTEDRPQMIMRFELFNSQTVPKNPKIICVLYNGLYKFFIKNFHKERRFFFIGTFSEATIAHDYFIEPFHKCFYKAAKNPTNQAEVFADNRWVPFRYLSWYYGKK